MATHPNKLACFKAYDIRGRIPDEIDADLARRIALAYATFLKPRRVAVGHDVRPSSPELADAVREGLLSAGVDVVDIGTCGTEQVYFATFHLDLDGGIMVTASHNPADHNGLKLVRDAAKPISADSGLAEIEEIVRNGTFAITRGRGRVDTADLLDAYVAHVLGTVDLSVMRPLSIVSNPGNGGAGVVVDRLAERLPFRITRVAHEPDGTFPSGIPNPLLPERRRATSDAVVRARADVGIAWDGDFDRCFFFDETGVFVEGYYLVGLIAAQRLASHPGATIVHDPRLTWNTIEVVRGAGGVPVQSKSGHAFMKESMRREGAVYGGEMSAHHFFEDFGYCDSGMIPWLLVAEIMSASGTPLSELVGDRVRRFPASGEINRRVDDVASALERVRARYAPGALRVDEMDGIGIEHERWRFNLRPSNTEPLLRLNVESRGDADLMRSKTEEILALVGGESPRA